MNAAELAMWLRLHGHTDVTILDGGEAVESEAKGSHWRFELKTEAGNGDVLFSDVGTYWKKTKRRAPK